MIGQWLKRFPKRVINAHATYKDEQKRKKKKKKRMNFVAAVIAVVLGVRASDVKPVDANAFVAELNGLLVKYHLPSSNLLLAPGVGGAGSGTDISLPLKPKDSLSGSTSTATGTTMTGTTLTTSTSGIDSGVSISKEEFEKAFTENKFAAQPSQYQGFLDSLKVARITTKREAAMYLAQLIHESGGLKFKAEWFCTQPNNQEKCAADYAPMGGVGEKGKVYYARGFLQMRGAVNYWLASQTLHGNDELVRNPDKVSTDDVTSWEVSGWLWGAYVHSVPGVDKGLFGVSTFALTGGKGCAPAEAEANANRRKYYEVIFKVFGLPGNPESTIGC